MACPGYELAHGVGWAKRSVPTGQRGARKVNKPVLGRLALNEVKPNADHVIYTHTDWQYCVRGKRWAEQSVPTKAAPCNGDVVGTVCRP